jgi:hypothetical protein
MTIVPWVMTTLPLKRLTWFCRSAVPDLSASTSMGLARSAFSASTGPASAHSSSADSRREDEGREKEVVIGTKLAEHSSPKCRAPTTGIDDT